MRIHYPPRFRSSNGIFPLFIYTQLDHRLIPFFLRRQDWNKEKVKKIVDIRGNKKSFQLCFHLCRIVRAKIDRCKRGFVHIYIRSTKYLLIDNRMGQRVRWTLTSLTGYILSHPIHIFNILCSKLTRYHVVEFAWYSA